MASSDVSLTVVVHGNSGVGKSWFSDTAPGPRLVIDAEGGTKWTPSNKVQWNPLIEAIPEASAEPGMTTVVRVLDFSTIQHVYKWLQSGHHPFRSVVVDSITDAQTRCMKAIAGTALPQQQDWGALLIQMSDLITDLRDLTDHPTNPVQCVVFIAGTQEKNGFLRPYIQGQLALKLPYYVDVLGYLYVVDDGAGGLARCMMIQPFPGFDAKDRTNLLTQEHGGTITNPTLPTMLEVLRRGREFAGSPSPG